MNGRTDDGRTEHQEPRTKDRRYREVKRERSSKDDAPLLFGSDEPVVETIVGGLRDTLVGPQIDIAGSRPHYYA
jgi:hypothetical protein